MPNTPKGFLFAVEAAGFRKELHNDTALVLSTQPASAAGVFTQNLFCAAPVIVGKEILKQTNLVRGVLINTGQANASTGEIGLKNCKRVLSMMADSLDIQPQEILPASTGVIGPSFNMEKWEKVIPKIAKKLGKSTPVEFAKAIMTTDAFHKLATRQIMLSGGEVKLMGMAKGAGMICPNMATMISVLLCDAQVEPKLWEKLIQQAVYKTFNRVSVDGDTSTNDTVYGLANGASGVSVSEEDAPALLEALTGIFSELAYLLVRDGEGATKVLHINVTGAKTDADAELVARTIGHSPLVKTAFYGNDANWGRIVAAIGRSGANFNPDEVSVSLCGHELFAKGQPVDFDFDPVLVPLLKEVDITIDVCLGSGNGEYDFKASDFGHAYIDCNASYRS